MNDYKIFALSGGSGSGKTAVLQKLDGTVIAGRQIRVMTSLTTRALREPDEAYRRTVGKEEFEALRPHMAQCITFGGHSYGILADDVDQALADESIVFADVIAEGVKQLERKYRVRACFLYARPAVLLRRMLERKTSEEEIRRRMELSVRQLRDAIDAGCYTFIENEDLESTIRQIRALLLGDPVETAIPDADAYLAELKEVMANETRAEI